MLQYEYKENIEIEHRIETETVVPKLEPIETEPEEQTDRQDNWLDFFSNTTELDVDEMIIKPEKKTEERNDMENLIETNVIPKQEVEENHLEEAKDMEIIQENEISNHTVKEEVTNCKSFENHEDVPNELLPQPTSPKKRIMKYMDPTTGKIYYLEMDRNLDLSKVQEIVINSQGKVKTAKISPIKPNGLKNVRRNTKKPGMSLLKPEVKSLLKNENLNQKKSILKKTYTHIENDHCYLGTNWAKNLSFNSNIAELVLPDHSEITENVAREEIVIKKEKSLYECLCNAVNRFTSIKVAVNYLLKKIPVICGEARDPDYLKYFPFVVDNEERYWKMDFAKRRNIEVRHIKSIYI